MRNKKLNRKAVLAELKKFSKQDLQYEEGRFLCSMCTAPHYMMKTFHGLFEETACDNVFEGFGLNCQSKYN